VGKLQAGVLSVFALVAAAGLGALFLLEEGPGGSAELQGARAVRGDSETGAEPAERVPDLSDLGASAEPTGEASPIAAAPEDAAGEAVSDVGAPDPGPPAKTVQELPREWRDAKALGGAYPSTVARAVLVEYLAHEDFRVRIRAAHSLAAWEDSGSALLARAATEARPEVSAEYVSALGQGAAGTAEMIPKLEELTKGGTHYLVRKAAEAAIVTCCKRAKIAIPQSQLTRRKRRRTQ
jgi:hypothetical protein